VPPRRRKSAYWNEIGSQADFIFSVAWETMKYADMHAKGISLIHLYEEGTDLDFNIGLYFYEKLWCVAKVFFDLTPRPAPPGPRQSNAV